MNKSKRNLGVILARYDSSRYPGKVVADCGGLPIFLRAKEILDQSRVVDTVIVSTDVEGKDGMVGELCDKYKIPCIAQKPAWHGNLEVPEIARLTVLDYITEKAPFKECYDDYTAIFGTALFVRPSWIREALKTVRTGEWDEVLPFKAPYNSFVWKVQPKDRVRTYWLQHFGFNLDLDWPEDLQLNVETYKAIRDGHITYPFNENYHERHHGTPPDPGKLTR